MEKTFGNFTFIETPIKGVYVIEVKKYGDNRGYFMETYQKENFDKAGLIFNSKIINLKAKKAYLEVYTIKKNSLKQNL